MDRRAFVKSAVGAGAIGAAAGGGYLVGRQVTLQEATAARPVPYVGAKSVVPIAPRGLPLLPLDVTPEGRLRGRVVRAPEGGETLAWYENCGHEDAPGLTDRWNGDEFLRYFATPDKLAQGYNPWWRERVGQPMRVTDFREPGFGATGAWRSEGASGTGVLPFVVLRTGTDPSDVAGTGKPLTFEAVPAAYEELVRSQVEELGFVALFAPCTHFCCVSGWREARRLQESRDAWDHVFCTCHFAQFDPSTYTVDEFLPPDSAP